RYTERLTEACAAVSVGSKGDSYDNALADTVIGLYKTALVDRHGPWRSIDVLELATLAYIGWYNHSPLHSACGYRPPAAHKAAYYACQKRLVSPSVVTQTTRPSSPGRFSADFPSPPAAQRFPRSSSPVLGCDRHGGAARLPPTARGRSHRTVPGGRRGLGQPV